MIPQLTAVFHPPASGKPADRLVVLLHGFGSDGRDLISLAQEWSAALPTTAFVAPNAPFGCEDNPYGFQWFSLRDRTPATQEKGAREALPILNAFLDDVAQRYGVPPSKMALVGFSQGALMSLTTGPRREACAGIISFSGLLMDPPEKSHEHRCKPPILVIHGDEDTVIRPTVFAPMVAQLEASGFAVESHLQPRLGHSIDAQGVAWARDFLVRVLA